MFCIYAVYSLHASCIFYYFAVFLGSWFGCQWILRARWFGTYPVTFRADSKFYSLIKITTIYINTLSLWLNDKEMFVINLKFANEAMFESFATSQNSAWQGKMSEFCFTMFLKKEKNTFCLTKAKNVWRGICGVTFDGQTYFKCLANNVWPFIQGLAWLRSTFRICEMWIDEKLNSCFTCNIWKKDSLFRKCSYCERQTEKLNLMIRWI